MYGISVNKKIMVGNRAIKNLNAKEDARVVRYPFCNPSIKNRIASYSGILSKPGKMVFLERAIALLTMGSAIIRAIIFFKLKCF
jgi:hypothetical protein